MENNVTIINNTDTILSPSAQQEICKAATHYGADKVFIYVSAWGGSRRTMFDIYEVEKEGTDVSNYIGTLDTEGNAISNMR